MRGYLIFILVVLSLPVFGSFGIGGAILGIFVAVLLSELIAQHNANKKVYLKSKEQAQGNSNAEEEPSSLIGVAPKHQVAFFGSYLSKATTPHRYSSSENTVRPPADLDVATAVLNGARIEVVRRNARSLKRSRRDQVFRYLQQREALTNAQNSSLIIGNSDDYLSDPLHPLYPYWNVDDLSSEMELDSFNGKGNIFATEDEFFVRSTDHFGLDYDNYYDEIGQASIDDSSYSDFVDSLDGDILSADACDCLDVSDSFEDTEWFDDAVEATTPEDFDSINE
ncbi:hypothetical protein Vca1114GL_00933 [Vibrio campbellii]|uniref:hypothetical protein n=1 Tax=Vibrio campbellii TaxID=680 RepID=UPI00097FABB7|nr:hypothetical protein [Vibrio campbellii]AQM67454.1 hypothetical protein Vca1114GL_00933 [Vibrio campbellii]